MGKKPARSKQHPTRHPGSRQSVSNARIMSELRERLFDDQEWIRLLDGCTSPNGSYRLHLAVFIEPYLQYIVEGLKTVESRFSVNFVSPHGRVDRDDVILLKRSSGPVVAVCRVSSSWTYALDAGSLREIRKKFLAQLCVADPNFWKARAKARYATLILISNVKPIRPLHVSKADRRGWVVLHDPQGTTGSLF